MSDIKILDNIDFEFAKGFQSSMHQIILSATDLAYYLACISLILTIVMMLMQGDEINKVFSKVLQSIFLFSMFFGLINLCGSWVPVWFNSFMEIGGKASGLDGLDPSSIFDQGYAISGTIVHTAMNLGITHIPTALLAMICALFIVIIYAMIAGNLAMLLIKSYALVAIGPFVFALGMSEITRSTVSNYINKLVGMGFNILTMYIVIGVGVHIGNDWVNNIQQSAASGVFDFGSILVVVGGLIMFYMAVQTLPPFIAGVSGAHGFRDYGQTTIATAMTAAATTANAMKGAATAPISARNAGATLGTSARIVGSGIGNVSIGGLGTLGAVGRTAMKIPSAPSSTVSAVKSTAEAFKSGGIKSGAKSLASSLSPLTNIVKPAITRTAKAFKDRN